MTIEQQADNINLPTPLVDAGDAMHDALGEAIDRGNQSRETVNKLRELRDRWMAERGARHLSSQAPGNLSEEEIERVGMERYPFYSEGKDPLLDGNRYRRADFISGIREGRSHYLSGWVAVSSGKLPEEGVVVLVTVQYLEFSMNSEEPGLVNKETIDLGQFISGTGGGRMEAFAGPHGETPDHIIAWMPIPPYTPQQEQR